MAHHRLVTASRLARTSSCRRTVSSSCPSAARRLSSVPALQAFHRAVLQHAYPPRWVNPVAFDLIFLLSCSPWRLGSSAASSLTELRKMLKQAALGECWLLSCCLSHRLLGSGRS